MEEDREEEVSVSGGHADILQAYRSDLGADVAVEKPPPLGVCLVDGIEMGE